MATEASRAILTIDLGALVENHQRLRRIAPRSEVAAVVKADGYGLGAREIAAALWQSGCRSFFVAHPAEGVALRAESTVMSGTPVLGARCCCVSRTTSRVWTSTL